MPMHWTPELAVGVEEIDEQHRELIERVNRLEGACAAGRCAAEIEPLISFLRDYAERHFADEENLMRGRDFPEQEFHIREHEAFRIRLAALSGRLSTDGPGMALQAELSTTVIDWLFDHICVKDRRLGKFLGAAS